MMRKQYTIVTVVAVFLFILAGYGTGEASVTLPWSTTFNCPAWTQSDGLGTTQVNCDGLSGWGGWTCNPGAKEEQITAIANNPNNTSGVGSKGQRQWDGDGKNINSGSLSLTFAQPPTEFWIRFYMKYPLGYQWNPLQYVKILYFDSGQPGEFALGWYGPDDFQHRPYSDARQVLHCSSPNCGWTTTMGGSVGDGQWHYYETHLKADTDGTNGISEQWIDGKKIMSFTDVNFGLSGAGWTYIILGSNQHSPNNGGCVAVDFDDFAISTTGYIGPLPDTLHPSNATGLQAN